MELVIIAALYILINVFTAAVVVDIYRVATGDMGTGRGVPSLSECNRSQWDGVLGRGRHAR